MLLNTLAVSWNDDDGMKNYVYLCLFTIYTCMNISSIYIFQNYRYDHDHDYDDDDDGDDDDEDDDDDDDDAGRA